jgi:PhnB protein
MDEAQRNVWCRELRNSPRDSKLVLTSGGTAMSDQAAAPRKTAISPMLAVRNGAKAVLFYQAAFGVEVLFKLEEGGSVVAQLSLAGAEFWLADESPEHGNFSPESVAGSTVRLIMVVEDPDAAFAKAVAAGAKVVWPVDDQPYGWRVGRIVDPFGHHWEIGKPL